VFDWAALIAFKTFGRRSRFVQGAGSASASGPSFNSVTIALSSPTTLGNIVNCRRRFRVGLPTFRRYCDGLSIQRLLACILARTSLARRHSCAPLLRTLEQDPIDYRCANRRQRFCVHGGSGARVCRSACRCTAAHRGRDDYRRWRRRIHYLRRAYGACMMAMSHRLQRHSALDHRRESSRGRLHWSRFGLGLGRAWPTTGI